MKHWLISTYSKQMFNCRTEVDTRCYVRNKVASVAVGVCEVTEMPLAFAALFAQDAAQGMRCYGDALLVFNAAQWLREVDAALPRCPGDAPPRLHPCRTGSAVNATATAMPQRCHCATPLSSHGHDATHRHAVSHPSTHPCHHPPLRRRMATPPMPPWTRGLAARTQGASPCA